MGLCLGTAALLCPGPCFPLLLSFPNSHLSRIPSQASPCFPGLSSDWVPGSGTLPASKCQLGEGHKMSHQGLSDTSDPLVTTVPKSLCWSYCCGSSGLSRAGSHEVPAASQSGMWPCLATSPLCAPAQVLQGSFRSELFVQQPG